MAGESIEVTLSAMENYSKTFSDCSKKVVEIAQTLATASSSMKPAWEDPAQLEFETSLEEMVNEFEKLYGCLSAMSSFSAYVAERYRTTDQTIKALL